MPFNQQQLLNRTNFSIRGGPDKARFINLNMQGPSGSPDSIPLSIGGPSAESIPLFIGLTRLGSGDASLYINGSIGSTPSYEGYQGYMSIALPATPNSGIALTSTLNLQAPLVGHVNLGQTLTFPQLPSGGYYASAKEELQMSLEGGTTSAEGSLSKFASLNIQNRVSNNSSATLVIEKDFNYSNNITFYMQSQSGIGDLTFVTDGVDWSSSAATLTVKTQEVKDLTIYTSGYLE